MAEAVADAAVVLTAADQDPDGLVVVVASEDVVDECDIEVKLAGVFGLEFAGLEFDDDVAGLVDVEEEQVEVEIVDVDVEVDLAADEGETGAELAEGFGDSAGQGVFEVAFGDFT